MEADFGLLVVHEGDFCGGFGLQDVGFDEEEGFDGFETLWSDWTSMLPPPPTEALVGKILLFAFDELKLVEGDFVAGLSRDADRSSGNVLVEEVAGVALLDDGVEGVVAWI